jgi:hypothetical protein
MITLGLPELEWIVVPIAIIAIALLAIRDEKKKSQK